MMAAMNNNKSMHRNLLFIAGLLFAALPVTTAHAGDLYFGAKAGPMQVDIGGADDPTNGALVLGYGQGIALGQLALEGELSTSLDNGTVRGREIEVDTAGAYVAFRSPGPVYFKARGGVVNVDTSVGGVSNSETGAAYGVGLGFGIGVAQVEVEITAMENDARFFSIGVQF